MKIKLKQEHINTIIAESDLYKKRDIIQDIGKDFFKESGFNLVCTWATSLGKTVFACKIMQEIRKKHDKEIHVCVPYTNLKTQWEKTLKDFNITNVEVFVIDTYMKNPQSPFLLIVDECHFKISNPETQASVINDFPVKYRLYLSATLKNTQLEYLASKNIINEFEITLKEAKLLGLIPSYEVYNVYVDLTEEEKNKYSLAIDTYNKYMDFFKSHNIDKLGKSPPIIPGYPDKKVAGMFFQALGSRSKFMAVIHNAQNKIKAVEKLLPVLKGRKTIFFSKNSTTAAKIASIGKMALYHSKQTPKEAKKNYEDFLEGNNIWISSVAKMIAGVDDKNIVALVRHSFDSVSNAGVQSLGRLLRPDTNNPDKRCIAINLICRPFETYTPNDNFWIAISLKGVHTKWVEVDELIDILNKC